MYSFDSDGLPCQRTPFHLSKMEVLRRVRPHFLRCPWNADGVKELIHLIIVDILVFRLFTRNLRGDCHVLCNCQKLGSIYINNSDLPNQTLPHSAASAQSSLETNAIFPSPMLLRMMPFVFSTASQMWRPLLPHIGNPEESNNGWAVF